MDPFPLANGLGFLALGSYCLTVLPTNLRIVVPSTKQSSGPRWLLQNRRAIGVLSFFLALGHGYLLVQKRDIDFLDPTTFIVYIQGISTFIVFTMLAITSNDWSIKRLKKNWKRLHNLTYLAMFLLTWHVWDKMADHWSYITPWALFAMVFINLLYVFRCAQEHSKRQQAAQTVQKIAQQSKRKNAEATCEKVAS
jgi:methionine sulfoxide reductase heme-binding subunit